LIKPTTTVHIFPTHPQPERKRSERGCRAAHPLELCCGQELPQALGHTFAQTLRCTLPQAQGQTGPPTSVWLHLLKRRGELTKIQDQAVARLTHLSCVRARIATSPWTHTCPRAVVSASANTRTNKATTSVRHTFAQTPWQAHKDPTLRTVPIRGRSSGNWTGKTPPKAVSLNYI